MGYPHKQPNDYTCGASALAYLLDTDSLTAGKGFAPEDLAEQLECDPEEGTSPGAIGLYLFRMGISYKDVCDPRLSDIRLPALVNYFDGEDGHWGVVCGMSFNPAGSVVAVFDPADAYCKVFPWGEFVAHWHSPRYGKRRAIWLLPPMDA